MGFLMIIRKWALRDKMPIREIARRTGVSRNTIKKYLREGIVEPEFQTPDRPSKLDPYAARLTEWLVSDQRKSRKDRRTAKLMHADLVKLGYDGSYERVAAFVREWKGERQRAQRTTDRGVFVPLAFRPGEAFQFDWSEDWAYVGGERIKLQVAHIKLSHSRAFLVRAYLLQTHEMLFDAHWHAFRVFEGVPERGIYDNMKTAVDKVGVGKKRDVNARFLAMVSHYVFEPEFCNPAAGWEKGQVEKNVRDARHRMWQVVAVTGDGAFGFSAIEIDTAARHKVPILIVVSNNGSWAIEVSDQMERFGKAVGTELQFADYAAMARAFGLQAWRITGEAEIAPCLDAAFSALAAGHTVLIDAITSPEARSSDSKTGLAWVPDLQALAAWDDAECAWLGI